MSDVDEIEELRRRVAAAEELSAQLELALSTRVVIEQAKGVLAERLQVGTDEAFELLRDAARSSRTKLRELAAQVVCERVTPAALAGALARSRCSRAALVDPGEQLRTRVTELRKTSPRPMPNR